MKATLITYECCCADIRIDEWNNKMRGARPCSYKRLVERIRKDCPEMYQALNLDLWNPYAEQCRRTPNYFVLVSSATEYFFRKV